MTTLPEFTGTTAAPDAAFNQMIDNFKLANLPVLKYEPTLWQRVKQWVKSLLTWPLRWLRWRSERQKEIDQFIEWFKKAKRPALLLHPDDFGKLPKTLQAACEQWHVEIKKDVFMEKGKISGIDMAYFDFRQNISAPEPLLNEQPCGCHDDPRFGHVVMGGCPLHD